jgi:hypothetical protein
MPPCGCSGSTQTRTAPRVVTQKSPSMVPGGPGESGYTWDGPQKPAVPAAPAKTQ